MKRYSFFLTPALLASLALAQTGCTTAHAAPSNPQATPPAQAAVAAPPLNTVSLPPAPVPATFDVAALSEKVRPMVVNITTTHKVDVPQGMIDPFEFFFGQRGQRGQRSGPMVSPEREMKQQALGTGFIIDASGYVVTNEHVVHDADDVRVRLADEREFPAEIVGRDPKLDVALIKLKGAKDLPVSPLGSSEALRVGEHVLAVGNPFGLGHTVTLGIVSAKARAIGAGPYDDFIQTDASINPGNSGGPLFNWRGEVVGVNTAIRAGANGIGFAIPIDAIKDVLPQLREKGYVERGKLGLGFQPVSPDMAKALGLNRPAGAMVTEVEPNSPADRAGIKSGDLITSVDGASIDHAEELPRRVARNAPGTTIKVELLRDKKPMTVNAKLDKLADESVKRGPKASDNASPSSEHAAKLGIRVSEVPGTGVRVDDVVDDALIRDLAPGDVIVEVNKKPVKNMADLRAAMASLKPGSAALLKVRRGKAMLYAAVPIPSR